MNEIKMKLSNLIKRINMKTMLIGVLVSIVTFFTPIKGLLMLMGGMVFSDTVFAMYVAYTMGNGIKSLTSTRFFNIAPKLFFYLGGIILAFMVDEFIACGGLFGVKYFGSKVITMAFISNEIKSLNETYIKKFGVSLFTTLKGYLNTAKELKKDIAELLDTDK